MTYGQAAKGKVEVIVDEQGRVVVDINGIKGTGCEAIKKALEAHLGEATHETTKPCYYEEVEVEEGVNTWVS